MDFAAAITELKFGRKVAREGWNGKGMFLFLVPGSRFYVTRPPLLGIYPEGTEINYHPHIDMRTADGTIVPWTASQSDLLSSDWIIVTASHEEVIKKMIKATKGVHTEEKRLVSIHTVETDVVDIRLDLRTAKIVAWLMGFEITIPETLANGKNAYDAFSQVEPKELGVSKDELQVIMSEFRRHVNVAIGRI